MIRRLLTPTNYPQNIEPSKREKNRIIGRRMHGYIV